jgi:hypothetical protein
MRLTASLDFWGPWSAGLICGIAIGWAIGIAING